MWIHRERAAQRPAQWGDKAAQLTLHRAQIFSGSTRPSGLPSSPKLQKSRSCLPSSTEAAPALKDVAVSSQVMEADSHSWIWAWGAVPCLLLVWALLFALHLPQGKKGILMFWNVAITLGIFCLDADVMITRDMLLYGQWRQDSLLKLELWAHSYLCQCIWSNSHQLQLKSSHFYTRIQTLSMRCSNQLLWFVLQALSSRKNLKCTKSL